MVKESLSYIWNSDSLKANEHILYLRLSKILQSITQSISPTVALSFSYLLRSSSNNSSISSFLSLKKIQREVAYNLSMLWLRCSIIFNDTSDYCLILLIKSSILISWFLWYFLSLTRRLSFCVNRSLAKILKLFSIVCSYSLYS